MESLDVWNPSLNQEQKDKVIKDNFAKLNNAMQFLGAEVLASIQSRTAQTITSNTAYAAISMFDKSFVSNGGLFLIIVLWLVLGKK